MRLTKKQRKVLTAVCEGIKDEQGRRVGWLDTQMICDRVDYEVSIHSMKFTIRFLMERGLVEKEDQVLRRDRWVTPVKPTNEAFDWVYHRVDPREIEHDNGVVELLL